MEWQPIETAPKDGTALLLGHSEAVFSGWWTKCADDGPGWVTGETNLYGDFVSFPVSHWQPLPKPPERKS